MTLPTPLISQRSPDAPAIRDDLFELRQTIDEELQRLPRRYREPPAPFVPKVTGVNLARIASRVMAGKTLEERGVLEDPQPSRVSVKESVFPFAKFPGVDITTLAGARAAVAAMETLRQGDFEVYALQDLLAPA